MKKKQILIAICILAVTACAFVYGRNRLQQNNTKARSSEALLAKQQEVYEMMFRHYMALKKKSEQAEQEGKEGQDLRRVYKETAKLSEQQSAQLDAVASECISKIAALEGEAKQIIAKARARIPGGRLAEGQAPPPPPDELTMLQQEREAIVLQSREKLREQFGAREFARFDAFVQRKIAASMKDVKPLDMHHPTLPQGTKP
jgi:hypothetical protein